MRRRIFMLTLLATAACGTDSMDIVDPIAANATAGQATAIVNVDGTQYEIGCPDYPCPVTSIVLQHIANRQWFWMPPGTFKNPTIYLYILRTPVQLHEINTPSILPPPATGPTLTGPSSWVGVVLPPINQVTCGLFPLTLNSPDNGTWDFLRGEITYEYVKWNATSQTWVPTGATSVVTFGAGVWNQLLAGTYTLYPPLGNLEYYANFSVTLFRGTTMAQVDHRMLCELPPPPVVDPPAPSLDGPAIEAGSRSGPGASLMCTDVQLTLISPDNGPWDYVSGEQLIEFMSWDKLKKMWFPNGNTSTSALSSGDWQSLLNGTYDLDPGTPSGPYQATFTFMVERGQYQHTISHQMTCAGPDFMELTAANR